MMGLWLPDNLLKYKLEHGRRKLIFTIDPIKSHPLHDILRLRIPTLSRLYYPFPRKMQILILQYNF